jgi:hypothetical protein
MTDDKSDSDQEKLLQGFVLMDLKDIDPTKKEGTLQGI